MTCFILFCFLKIHFKKFRPCTSIAREFTDLAPCFPGRIENDCVPGFTCIGNVESPLKSIFAGYIKPSFAASAILEVCADLVLAGGKVVGQYPKSLMNDHFLIGSRINGFAESLYHPDNAIQLEFKFFVYGRLFGFTWAHLHRTFTLPSAHPGSEYFHFFFHGGFRRLSE